MNERNDSAETRNTRAAMNHGEILVNEQSLAPEEDARLSTLKETLRKTALNLDTPDETNVVTSVLGREPEVGDLQNQAVDAHEQSRQVELMDQVHNQFRVAGSRFYFKEQPSKVAFKDKGESLVSASNDERVAKAMAAMADAKGWKTISVSGHPDFKRQVWMEATLRGIDVRGFKPTEQDLELLEGRRDRTFQNSIAHVGDNQELTHSKSLKDTETREHAQAQRSGLKGKNPSRAYEGQVLDHGQANFNHDPDEKQSYFVTLATAKGEKTVWGIDLKRAMSEGNVKSGDEIKLEFKGNTPVTVETLVRDKAGKVVGKEEITTMRNTWEAQKSDKAKVVEAVASSLIDAKVKNPAQREALKAAVGERVALRERANKVPVVPMYDKSAPSKTQQEPARPVVERTAERTR
ncbi:MAG TPA: LPD7 domain-containing protein [Oligoflexus sp.]|uniref:LPD7 domain-containing protein n=1 Tax=Oligoflexus sp. TaxID=1971216 RepID=UPI002D7F666E|nr:LPD7 domain-containing protein [Oligoflexus sp.]HET9239196.1 LPD7 domain-containing protein [Oligoflexus sp.]